MELETISREEFDRRLEQSTEQMRLRRLVLEQKASELEELIGRYSSVLERLKAQSRQDDSFSSQREELRKLLNELAERTTAVAAAL